MEKLDRQFRREWWMIVVIMLVIGMVLAFSLWQDYQNTSMREQERLATQCRIVMSGLERHFDAANRTLQSILGNLDSWYRRPGGIDDANRQLKAFVDAMPAVRSLAVLDKDGTVRITNQDALIGRNFRDREYFRIARDSPSPDRLYVGKPFVSALGVYTFQLGRMATTKDGTFNGVVVATLDPQELEIALESVRYASDMLCSLVHGSGIHYIASPPLPELQGVNLNQTGSMFREFIESGMEEYFTSGIVKSTGENRMLVQRKLKSSILKMDTAMVVAISRELQAIYAPWKKDFAARLLLFIALVLGTAGILWYSHTTRRKELARAQVLDSALQASKLESEHFFGIALDMLCIADIEGHFLKLNPAWEQVLGYPLADLSGASFLDYVHPDDLESTLTAMAQLAQEKPVVSFVNRYRTKSGDYRHIEWRSAPQGNQVYAAARDITERLLDEERLAQSERFLKNLVDILPGRVGYWDSGLHCGFANSAYLAWFGKNSDQVIGKSIQDLVSSDFLVRNEVYIQAVLRGEAQHFERTSIRDDGSREDSWVHYIPDMVDGELRGFFALTSDITEIKHVEVSLKNALVEADRFKAALDNVSAYIYMKDRQGKYVYANRPTLELFGCSNEALLGSEGEMYFPPVVLERIRAIDERVMTRGEHTAEEIEMVNERGDRTVFWEVKTPIYQDGSSSDIWGLCGVSSNITSRKYVEEELVRARQAAEASNKAKSEFLANMSHEIRTPMNAVLGLTRLVLDAGLPQEQSEMLGKAYESAQHLLVILNDILDYSKVEAGKMDIEERPFNLVQLIRRTGQLFGAQISQKGLAFLMQQAPEVPEHIVGDEHRLGQILGNLVNNAVKFTKQGSITVDVSLERQFEHGMVICFSVKDTGIGLTKAQQDNLFKPFSQADTSITRRYGGTGLGLAISRKLAKLMGGDLACSSTPGEGATFTFTIQAGKVDAQTCLSPQPEVSGVAHIRFDGLQVLLVEDNVLNQRVAVEYLTRRGVVVQVANDGSEACRLVVGKHFDVVLMDLHMPVMDGFEATQKIKSLPGIAAVPIIAMTAAVMPEDRIRCEQLGMVDFVAKPIDPDELVRTLCRWVPSNQLVSAAVPVNVPDIVQLPAAPLIPGFDLVGALQRMGGDLELLHTLFEDFLSNFATMDRQIEELIRDDNQHGLLHAVHSVHGVAGTVGAVDLAAHAAKMEQLLHNGARLGLNDTIYEHFLDLYVSALNGIRKYMLLQGGDDTVPIPAMDLKAWLVELSSFIRRYEVLPDEYMDTLKELARQGGHPSDARKLLDCVNKYDHEGALDIISRMTNAETMEASG